MRSLKQLIHVLATGYILMFYSELLFWARVRPDDSLGGWLATWLAYSLLGFVFLSLLARFQVNSIWALFLAGAAFGWLAEGLVVQTAYEDLPLSISFTGLAWHALISVWAGWYGLRRALAAGLHATLVTAGLTGCGFGLWAIAWWLEPDGGVAAPLAFAAYALASSLLLMLACWLHERSAPFQPSRQAEIGAALLFGLYFIFITIPAAPLAAVILPGLLLVLYLGLRRSRTEQAGNMQLLPAPAMRYLGLLALPLAASLVYAASFALGLRWHTNWLLYLVATPAGFILLAVSLVKASSHYKTLN